MNIDKKNLAKHFPLSFKKGKTAEKIFFKLLGDGAKWAEPDQDRFEKWDMMDKQGLKYDVKSHKGIYNYIEITSETGFKGWIYGKADVIAFQIYETWALVKRVDLLNWVDENIKDRTTSNKRELYKCFQKKDRKDCVVYVKSIDLIRLAYKIIR